jgi:hypothetical protein
MRPDEHPHGYCIGIRFIARLASFVLAFEGRTNAVEAFHETKDLLCWFGVVLLPIEQEPDRDAP